MSDKIEKTQEESNAEEILKTEMIELRQLAISIGMVIGGSGVNSISPQIGKAKLQEKIAAYQEDIYLKAQEKRALEEQNTQVLPDNLPVTAQPNETKNMRRTRMLNEASRLVRCTIACLNRDKSEWHGEVLTFSNSFIGSIKKFIPFNSENAYHVPQVLITMMEDRKHTIFKTKRDNLGRKIKYGIQVPEFQITKHPALTVEEHAELRKIQLLSKGDTSEL